MRIAVIFYNIGGYHAARLAAADRICRRKGWELYAAQLVSGTEEHPWGDMRAEINFSLETLSEYGVAHASAALPGYLDRTAPDVVAIPGWGTAAARTALRWCLGRRRPTVLMSESKEDDAPRSKWKEWLKSRVVKKFDSALVGGASHRDYLVGLGFPQERIFLGYDTVDNAYFALQSDAARRDPGTVRSAQPGIPLRDYFLAVTRLVSRKNVARLIRAYAAYRRRVTGDEPWDLVVCGGGPEEPAVRELIKRTGLQDFVHLPGFVSYRRIGAWYGLARAFVHPAIQEQWGLVVNEACASGLPVLCSSTTGAAHELLRPENGWTFDPLDEAAIAVALEACHRDAGIAGKGSASRRIVEAYGLDRFADGFAAAVEAAQKAAHR